jgi:hypothetical protein
MTAADNARKVLELVKEKLKIDKFPRGTFIESFGENLAYIRYNGCIEGRFDSTELSKEEVEKQADLLIKSGNPKFIGSEDFLAPEDIPPCLLS